LFLLFKNALKKFEIFFFFTSNKYVVMFLYYFDVMI